MWIGEWGEDDKDDEDEDKGEDEEDAGKDERSSEGLEAQAKASRLVRSVRSLQEGMSTSKGGMSS